MRRTIGSRADLETYFAAFNARDYALQTAHYAPDVLYRIGTLTLSSPAQIADFYADFHEHCREEVRLADFAMTGDSVAAIVPTRFEPFRDYVKHGLSFIAGAPVNIVTFAFYRLKQGQIHRIRMARYAGDPANFA